MLVCMKCHMEYEEGTDFCPRCGGSLAAKGKPASEDGGLGKTEEMKPDGKLICPNCRILFEKRKSCVRCGAPLVKQSDLKEMEKSKPPEPPESKKEQPQKEPSQVQPLRKEPTETKSEKPKPSQPPEVEQETPSIQAPEKRPAKRLPEDIGTEFSLSPKEIKSFLRSSLGVLSIVLVVVAAIYFIWSQYFYFTEKPSRPAAPDSEKATHPSIPSSQESKEKETVLASEKETSAIPSSSIPVVNLSQEIARIKGLLENIRHANLRKNIDLFMSCYSVDFKDREERKKTTLEFWEKFTYADLSYALKVDSVSIDSAKARVEWRMEIIPKGGREREGGKTVLDVIFQKENNQWKIKEVTPIS